MSGQNVRRLSLVLALTAGLALGPRPLVAEGMWIDPNGATAPSEGDGDAGMLIDPNGATAPSEGDSDEGTRIDPNGATAPSGGDGDAGMWIDPNG